MNLLMLLKVFRIDEGSGADVALVRTLTGVTRLDVIIQQTTSLETSIANITFVSFVIEMCCAFVGLQIRALREACVANLANKRTLSGMRSFVILNFCLPGKALSTCPAYERFVVQMYDFMDVEIVLRHECFATILADIVPSPGVDFLVLDEIVLAVETFAALFAVENSLSLLVGLKVCRERIFRCEILRAHSALEGPPPGVHIHVIIEQVLGAVLFLTHLTRPNLGGGHMILPMHP